MTDGVRKNIWNFFSGQRRARCNSMLTHVIMAVLFLAAGYVFLFESIIFWLQFGVLGIIYILFDLNSLIIWARQPCVRLNKTSHSNPFGCCKLKKSDFYIWVSFRLPAAFKNFKKWISLGLTGGCRALLNMPRLIN